MIAKFMVACRKVPIGLNKENNILACWNRLKGQTASSQSGPAVQLVPASAVEFRPADLDETSAWVSNIRMMNKNVFEMMFVRCMKFHGFGSLDMSLFISGVYAKRTACNYVIASMVFHWYADAPRERSEGARGRQTARFVSSVIHPSKYRNALHQAVVTVHICCSLKTKFCFLRTPHRRTHQWRETGLHCRGFLQFLLQVFSLFSFLCNFFLPQRKPLN